MSKLVKINDVDEIVRGVIDVDPDDIFSYKGIVFNLKVIYEEELREEYVLVDFDIEQCPRLENIFFCSGESPENAIINFIDILEDVIFDEDDMGIMTTNKNV